MSSQLDAADDWIVDHINKNDIVITGDIPLASRIVKKGARMLSPKGVLITESSMGNMLATRGLMTYLLNVGINAVRQAIFNKKDRSRFLQSLDKIIHSIRNGS